MLGKRAGHGAVVAAAVIVLVVVAVATMATASLSRAPSAPAVLEPSLRQVAGGDGFLVGTAVRAEPLVLDRTYARGIARQYNALTAENELKWAAVRPSRARFDFRAADAVVSFAARHGMAVRGHTLVWHRNNPRWLTMARLSRDEMVELLREHVRTVVGRYRGRVVHWDVVNEAVSDAGRLRRNIWLDRIGPEYLEIAFRAAREADPSARLFYNDYGFEQGGPKTDAILWMLADLRARGVPVDGLGFQLHVDAARWRAPAVSYTMARAAAIGLDVAVTELDVRIPVRATGAERRRQARVYGDAARVCRSAASCRTFVTWGWTDRYSWVPVHFRGMGSALPFDDELVPKPAARALRSALAA